MQQEIVKAIDAKTLGAPQLEPDDIVLHVSTSTIALSLYEVGSR